MIPVSRQITIQNAKLQKLLEKRKELSIPYNKVLDEMERLAKERDILLNKMQRIIVDKIKPQMAKILPTLDLGEYEIMTEVSFKGEDITLDIVDQVEMYKQQLNAKKDEEAKKLAGLGIGNTEEKAGNNQGNGQDKSGTGKGKKI